VSADAWPEGLHPLAKKLESVGIEFGLWFEPEMIQLDSDAFRAHPEWVLAVPGRLPFEWRSQQVIDLANPEAFAHVLEQMDAVLTEYPAIRYLKWDHNRPVVDAAHAGHPAIRLQTQAVYRLFDELKNRHPGLEVESCSSGGGRIDLGILEHTDRVWVSDSNDALERQRMQRWTTQVLPPELMGTHIGPHHAHTSGRTHALTFRAITALFGHAGLEWDITETTTAERAVLRSWADYYKANRELLHSGRVVRVDTHEPTMSLHGVVAYDKSRAVFAVVQEGVTTASRPQPLHFPGLDPDRRYRVSEVRPAGAPHYWQIDPTPWIANPVELTGRVLAEVGLTAPILTSEQATLLEFWAI
jgi:alpha-galactosidase